MQIKHQNNIIFHYGPRKCGKSIFVEKELSAYLIKTYIGTLQNEPQYMQTIIEHQKRRTDSWTTLEVSENFESDLQKINGHVNKQGNGSACMIDGLVTWFEFLKKTNTKTVTWQYFSNGLIQLIKQNNITWRLVDVDPEIFKGSTARWTDYKKMHQELISKLEIKQIIDWRYEYLQNTLD